MVHGSFVCAAVQRPPVTYDGFKEILGLHQVQRDNSRLRRMGQTGYTSVYTFV